MKKIIQVCALSAIALLTTLGTASAARNNRGNGPRRAAPELDGSSAVVALGLIAGAVAILHGRRRLKA